MAEPLACRALDIRQEVTGTGSKDIAAAMCMMADILRELGK